MLVEGDDHDEPIADAARAILDGHIVLDRRVAERGRFPAIDVLRSVSRVEGVHDQETQALVAEARTLMAAYDDMRDMIRIGAYQTGSDASVDRAVAFNEQIERFLNTKSRHLRSRRSNARSARGVPCIAWRA